MNKPITSSVHFKLTYLFTCLFAVYLTSMSVVQAVSEDRMSNEQLIGQEAKFNHRSLV